MFNVNDAQHSKSCGARGLKKLWEYRHDGDWYDSYMNALELVDVALADMQTMIDYIENLNKWISVEDSVPKVGEKVICRLENGDEVLCKYQFDSDDLEYYFENCEIEFGQDGVTHWMQYNHFPNNY